MRCHSTLVTECQGTSERGSEREHRTSQAAQEPSPASYVHKGHLFPGPVENTEQRWARGAEGIGRKHPLQSRGVLKKGMPFAPGARKGQRGNCSLPLDEKAARVALFQTHETAQRKGNSYCLLRGPGAEGPPPLPPPPLRAPRPGGGRELCTAPPLLAEGGWCIPAGALLLLL